MAQLPFKSACAVLLHFNKALDVGATIFTEYARLLGGTRWTHRARERAAVQTTGGKAPSCCVPTALLRAGAILYFVPGRVLFGLGPFSLFSHNGCV
jgi:hypothetical protein